MEQELLKLKNMDNYFDVNGKLSVFNPEIYEVNGCVIIKTSDYRKKVTSEQVELSSKYKNFRTDLEHGRSEIRIVDFFDGLSYEQSLMVALDIIEIWSNKLHALFPKEIFHVVMHTDDTDITLYCHKEHEDERPWLNEDDLDIYQSSAILVRIVEPGVTLKKV